LRDVLNIGIMTLKILDAVVSVIGELTDGTTLEVATIGNEGLVGLPQFLQATTMLFTAFVQIPGGSPADGRRGVWPDGASHRE
jgi:hypothetical protein